jgi:hypothetical protein
VQSNARLPGRVRPINPKFTHSALTLSQINQTVDGCTSNHHFNAAQMLLAFALLAAMTNERRK